jgi:hypothetical protein
MGYGGSKIALSLKDVAMAATAEKSVVYTASGEPLSILPGTENPVPVDEMLRIRDEWLARYKPLLRDYSSDKFIAQKRSEVEAGLE